MMKEVKGIVGGRILSMIRAFFTWYFSWSKASSAGFVAIS
jgi:hypothetical protein